MSISFVAWSLVFAFAISFIIIWRYYLVLKNNSQSMSKCFKSTDTCIDDGVEEIKIICK